MALGRKSACAVANRLFRLVTGLRRALLAPFNGAMSLRPASILLIALIQAVLLASLIWTGLYWLDATNLQQLGQRAQLSARMLAVSAAVPLLADEPVRLDDLLAGTGLDTDLRDARVLDVDGALLAVRGDGHAFSFPSAPMASPHRVRGFPANHDHVYAAAPVLVGDQVLGRVEVGLTTSALDGALSKAFWTAIVLAGLQMLLVTGFSLLLARRRGRELIQLQRGAERVAQEGPGLQLDLPADHDLGRFAMAFNHMSQQLADSYAALRDTLAESRQLMNRVAESERHKLEDAARREQDAKEANEAKSRFLASMSHELRTPLNAILNMNELLLESGLEDEQRGYALTASDAASALLSIVNGVLDFSKIEAGRVDLALRPSDPEEIVRSVIDLLAARAYAKDVQLAICCEPSVPLQFQTDPGLVRQILLNLIGNAIKFTDAGAVRIRLGLSPDADALRIEVMDTGIGIAEDKQGCLFEEFVQADSSNNRKYGGSGLGLVISRRLARLLGGDIELRSALGEGSCFALMLPLPRGVDAVSDVRAEAAAPLLDWHLSLWAENALMAEDLAYQLAVFGLDVEIVPPTLAAAGIGCCGEILLEPKPGGEAARRTDRPRRIALYQLGSHCPTNLGEPGRAIAALRIPVVPSELVGRLVQAAAATSPILDADTSDDIAERVARCALSAASVLLAEDSRANQLVATSILSKAGFRVDVAENGLQAVAAVNRRNYGLVLMDVTMPEMDGLEATGCIRALPGKRGRLPIVAMTANVFAEDRQRCLDAGMDDFLIKPVERRALFEAMLRWLGADGIASPPTPPSGALPKRAERQLTFAEASDQERIVRGCGAFPAIVSNATTISRANSAADSGDDDDNGHGIEDADENAEKIPVVATIAGDEGPLDEAVIDALASDLSDELMPAVVATFIDEAEQRVSAIEQAAALGDAVQAGEEGHALKGSAATFGARQLRDIAFAVEEAGRAGSLDAVRAQLDGLRSQGSLAIDALRLRYCGTIGKDG